VGTLVADSVCEATVVDAVKLSKFDVAAPGVVIEEELEADPPTEAQNPSSGMISVRLWGTAVDTNWAQDEATASKLNLP
jgi:hypothetical protein